MQIPLLPISKGISLAISGPKKLYVSTDFHPRLEQPPKVKLYARVSSRVLFLYLKNKQPNLAFLSGRLTLSSDLGLSRSSSVQRSFFCGDVIAIRSWAPDVVNFNSVPHFTTLTESVTDYSTQVLIHWVQTMQWKAKEKEIAWRCSPERWN